MSRKRINYDVEFKFRVSKELLEAFKEVTGTNNISKVFREFMKETVEKAKETKR